MIRKQLTVAIATLMATPALGNLLTNPGFESDLDDWSFTSNASIRTGNPLAYEGTNYVFGRSTRNYTIWQDIDLAANNIARAAIDSGVVGAQFGGWQAGWSTQTDRGQISLKFLDEGMVEIGSSELPFFWSNFTWAEQAGSSLIPEGTRTIRYHFEGVRTGGSNNDAYLDAAYLRIQIPPGTNLISNGSFEFALDTDGGALPGVVDPNTGLMRDAFGPPDAADSIYVLNNGATAVDSWVAVSAIPGATTDWAHSENYAASDGERSMDLNGTPGPGGVAQFIAVTPGSRYRLEFDLAGNPRGLEDPDGEGPLTPPASFDVTMEVDADGATAPFSLTVDTEPPADPGWQRQSWELNAFDTELLLQFLSTTDPLYPGELIDFGPVIDNVTLVEIGVAGDYNFDGTVDAADYTVWRDTLGETGLVPFSGADGDGDGAVTVSDYEVWQAGFSGVGSAAPLSIPEPSAFVIVSALPAIAHGLVVRTRRNYRRSSPSRRFPSPSYRTWAM